MILRVLVGLIAVMFTAPFTPLADAQPDEYMPGPGTVLRLIRSEKLDLILPGAMRDNNVDMWIHVTRAGDPDPLVYEFGRTSGYLILTDLGDRIERAYFGGAFGLGAVPNIDVRGSLAISRAITGYDYPVRDLGSITRNTFSSVVISSLLVSRLTGWTLATKALGSIRNITLTF